MFSWGTTMIEWLIENKEWFFSGIGITLLSILFKVIFFNKKYPRIQQKGNGSFFHNGTGDINNIVNINNKNQTDYQSSTKNGIKTTYKLDPNTGTESVVSIKLD